MACSGGNSPGVFKVFIGTVKLRLATPCNFSLKQLRIVSLSIFNDASTITLGDEGFLFADERLCGIDLSGLGDFDAFFFVFAAIDRFGDFAILTIP
jgi:hypothetical protein